MRIETLDEGGFPVERVGAVLLKDKTGGPLQFIGSFPKVMVETGLDGLALIEEVRPGKYLLTSDNDHHKFIQVHAGKVTRIRWKLRGVQVHGVVVDAEGKPVPGAGIWLTPEHTNGSWTGGHVRAYADELGAFALSSIPKTGLLGALAPGFAHSDLIDLKSFLSGRSGHRIALRFDGQGWGVGGCCAQSGGQASVRGACGCWAEQSLQVWP